tara:strand:+ start:2098 stop:2601 length:504 start_codon:yes stop_codon:yes gene_type:complete
MTTPNPTGTIAPGHHGPELHPTRRIRHDIDEVWAALTESDRLEQWIGRFEGDPRDGSVTFFMTAEGAEAPGERATIVECTPPEHYAVETEVGDEIWHLAVTLDHDAGVTTLQFAQRADDSDLASVGPGWEYYLDRLITSLGGGDVAGVDWEHYFPAMSAYYAGLSAS